MTRVVEQGRPVAHVADGLGVGRATGYKSLARWRGHGLPVLWIREVAK
jgi:transposase